MPTDFPMTADDIETLPLTATHWGLYRALVENGRLKRLYPWSGDLAPDLAARHAEAIASLPYENRILSPMVREGFLKRGPDSRAERGRERFVAVSWDEAFALAAREIRRIYDDFGPDAAWGRSYGWMSPGQVNSAVTLARRLLMLMGGYVECKNSYSTAAISTIQPYVVGYPDPKSTAWPQILENAQQVVLLGADPLVTNDIDWSTTRHSGIAAFRGLAAKGLPAFDIYPIRTISGQALNARWVPVHPGTDTALLLALIRTLFDEGLADIDFLERATTGWRELRAHVFGRLPESAGGDGIDKTPEWAAERTGIDPETIRTLARQFARKETLILLGWGPQRARFGEMPTWAAWALAAVLGSIGRPGGGILTNLHYSSGGLPDSNGPRLGGISARPDPVRSSKPKRLLEPVPVASITEALLHPGKTIDFNGRKATLPDIRLILWAGGNPFAHQPQTTRLREAWRKPEAVICVETHWTGTARHADIVLPAATTFERSDITTIGTYPNEGIAYMPKLIDPVGEAKSDFEIFRGLAAALGMEAEMTEGLDETGWIERVYDDLGRRARFRSLTLPPFETFRRAGVLLFPEAPAERNYVAFADFRRDPSAHPLMTPSGRIELKSTRVAAYHYDDCPGLPSWFEPPEREALAKPNAFTLVTPKSRDRLHSQLGGTARARAAAEINGTEPVLLNPADMKRLGLRTGDAVLVYNKRGRIRTHVQASADVRTGVAVIRHGAWFDPEEKTNGTLLDRRGCANTLTLDLPTSKLARGNIAHGGIVFVDKWAAGK